MGFMDVLGNIAKRSKLATALFWAEITHNVPRINELKMSQGDPDWLKVITNYYDYFLKRRLTIPYVRYNSLDDFVIPIGTNKLKIGFIADWGTGQEDADWLLAEVMKHSPDLLIHLGDIYYSGTKEEAKTNFLDLIQKYVNQKKTRVFTLSGNHDMYSGGEGYYQLLQQLGQPASYFCLRNDYWQFQAMDTGLNDASPLSAHASIPYLDPLETDWHIHKLLTSDKRKTVLLSHHQLFSDVGVGEDSQGQKLVFNPHLQASFHNLMSQVECWLWGHEHNLILFHPYLNLQRGRCIGASAFPVMNRDFPYKTVTGMNLLGQKVPPKMYENVKLKTNADGVYYHSYLIMALDHASAKLSYYQTDSVHNGPSELMFEERL
ncbi:metallophosphoesterase family protein [Paenibacillus cremeus]|uniref:Metallophosphoesterase n=1 Tax=Paenibacillus cremeus TaxID=2163881 RepID=A0A559K0C6_9BACL|nr:metallophosphoesterase [Paenibacillus cremeus]TVY05599.1 metallophosphoesterase [Paenibacillus cremeus]